MRRNIYKYSIFDTIMERINQLVLDEYLLEQKEGNILQVIRRAFEEGRSSPPVSTISLFITDRALGQPSGK